MITHTLLIKTSNLSIFLCSNVVTKSLATTKTRSVVADVTITKYLSTNIGNVWELIINQSGGYESRENCNCLK